MSENNASSVASEEKSEPLTQAEKDVLAAQRDALLVRFSFCDPLQILTVITHGRMLS